MREMIMGENYERNITLIRSHFSRFSRGTVHKTSESRGTESILDAFILSNHDAQTGTLNADTRLAFANMWALQQQTGDEKGAWSWYHFDNQPWEASDSQYYGRPSRPSQLGQRRKTIVRAPTFKLISIAFANILTVTLQSNLLSTE